MDMVSDSLAGRIAIIEMTPLSLREIMKDGGKIVIIRQPPSWCHNFIFIELWPSFWTPINNFV